MARTISEIKKFAEERRGDTSNSATTNTYWSGYLDGLTAVENALIDRLKEQ